METNKVVIITGAAGGIGSAIARKFASLQYKLALVDYDREALDHCADQLRETYAIDCLCFNENLEQVDQLAMIVTSVFEKWQRIDIIINNAAWRTVETLRTIDVATWEKTIRICLTAPAFLTKWAAAYMEANKQSGVIINISSIMSQRPAGTSPAYIASKAALEGLTRELAVLYGPSGIRVLAISPGNVETSLSNDFVDDEGHNISRQMIAHMHQQVPLGRSALPEEIANACCWLSSTEASFITGTTLLVDGGFAANFNDYKMKKNQFPKEF